MIFLSVGREKTLCFYVFKFWVFLLYRCQKVKGNMNVPVV